MTDNISLVETDKIEEKIQKILESMGIRIIKRCKLIEIINED